MSATTQYRRYGWLMLLHIIAGAVILPVDVAAHFSPPQGMGPIDSLLYLLWLSFVGALAGYGLWKIE